MTRCGQRDWQTRKVSFVVRDAETDDDITRVLLSQDK
jgi:polyhydroxyalkanoate synthesis regulator protein